MSEYCIVANGPRVDKDFILKVCVGKKLLALDGAADILLKYGIKPDIILGDFDSIDSETKTYYGIKTIACDNEEYYGHHNVLIVHAFNQDYTDLEKAVQYCDRKSAKNITIIGATGGREDHHEYLKLVLKSYYKPCRHIFSHSEFGSMCYVENETVRFFGNPEDKCGFILQGPGSVISDGLFYQCNGHSYSIANKMLGKQASFYVSGGALLFLPIQLRALS